MGDRIMSSLVLERVATADAVKTRSRLSRKTLLISALVLLTALGALWYGYDWWTVGRFVESTDDAYVGGNVTPIAPRVAGLVAQILVTDNQHVSAGQLLVRIDDRDFQAALDRAAAVVREKEATLASLRARSVLQRSTIRQAEGDLAAKAAQADFAGQDAARYRDLARLNVGSRQDAQRTLAADRSARSAVLSSQAGLAASQQQSAVLDAEITEAEAAIVQAQADLRTARLDLGYSEIRSPIDGYVGNRAAQAGAYVSPGTYLLSIVPASGLWVDANLKEDDLAGVRPGDRATIVADAVPGQVFHGHVLSLAPGTGAIFSVIPPENATGNFTKIVQRVPIRIALDGGNATLGLLRPGLSTTVSIDIRHPAASVP
jgi:membrane fusion protein (multidrug efflux system)